MWENVEKFTSQATVSWTNNTIFMLYNLNVSKFHSIYLFMFSKYSHSPYLWHCVSQKQCNITVNSTLWHFSGTGFLWWRIWYWSVFYWHDIWCPHVGLHHVFLWDPELLRWAELLSGECAELECSGFSDNRKSVDRRQANLLIPILCPM